MAQKFYLNDAAAAYNPAVAKGAWDDTTNQPDIGQLGSTPSGAAATLTGTETTATNNWDVLLATFVSDALANNVSFKTTDYVTGTLGVSESATGMNAVTHIHIWVTTGNTDTVRGTLLQDNIGSTHWPTTISGLILGGLPLTNNVTAQTGDHIVVELGYQAQNTVTTSFTGTIAFGSNATGTDLVQGDTATTTHPSWIEFSTNFGPVVVELGATFNATSGTHTVVATPTANDLIVIVTASTGNTSSSPPTDNGTNGATYVLAQDPSGNTASALKNSSADLLQVFIRPNLIQYNNVSTTFTHAPGTSTGGGLVVYAIRGIGKVNIASVRQIAIQANQAAATPTPVFSQTPISTNPILTAVFNGTNPGGVTARTGYTRDLDTGATTPYGIDTAHRDNGETSATITWGGASASAFSSVALEFDMSTTTLENQQDTFLGQTTLNVAKWYDNTQSGGTQSVGASGVTLTAPASTANALAEVESQTRYTLIGSHAFVKMGVTDVNNANAEVGMTVYQDETGNQLQLIVSSGSLQAGYQVTGNSVTLATIAYNATTMAWIRIRESGGTIFYDYAADGANWTNLTSIGHPLDVTLIRTSVLAYDGASIASPEVGVYTNFNINFNPATLIIKQAVNRANTY